MNDISWFLYAVDLLGGLSDFSIAASICSAFIGGGGLIAFFISRADIKHAKIRNVEWQAKYKEDYAEPSEIETMSKIEALGLRTLRVCIYTFCGFVFLSLIIPSPKTMYLILGSEVGETAITSETGQRVHDAINKKLDEYLENN